MLTADERREVQYLLVAGGVWGMTFGALALCVATNFFSGEVELAARFFTGFGGGAALLGLWILLRPQERGAA